MKNYTITVNGNVYDVVVEEGKTNGVTMAAAPAAPSAGDGAAVQSADDGRRDRGAAGSGLPDARRPAALR